MLRSFYAKANDVPVFHRVDAADLHVRTLPDADRALYAAFADALAKLFGEHHGVVVRLTPPPSKPADVKRPDVAARPFFHFA